VGATALQIKITPAILEDLEAEENTALLVVAEHSHHNQGILEHTDMETVAVQGTATLTLAVAVVALAVLV